MDTEGRLPTYSEATSIMRIAIIGEEFPGVKMDESHLETIQNLIMEKVYEIREEDFKPRIKSSSLLGGAVHLICDGSTTKDWLIAHFEGNDQVLGGMKLRVLDAQNLPKPITVGFSTKNICTSDPEKLLKCMNNLNSNLHTKCWKVIKSELEGMTRRWVFEVDRKTLKAIAEADFKAYTGVDEGTFEVLLDPESKKDDDPPSLILEPKGDHEMEGEPTAEELYERVRGILNKLTPQKFDILLGQLKELEINTEEKLNGVVDLVFEKAIDEPNSSIIYANMCIQLGMIKVPSAEKEGQFVIFRKLLLTKCQKEFEQGLSDEIQREEKLKQIQQCDQEDKKKLLQEEFDEEERINRRRRLGNIRFIGELFKLDMLIEPIMHECIKLLLRQGDENSLECLCRLLTTIGKELDTRKDKGSNEDASREAMNHYFAEMQKIVTGHTTSSKVEFMLQDVIDLKSRSWIPRRDENNPKTIDQIHEEAERGAHEQQQRMQQKLKQFANKQPDVDNIQLGPGRGYMSWGKGSSGGYRTNAETNKSAHVYSANRFGPLLDQGYPNGPRRAPQRSPASSQESIRGCYNPMSSLLLCPRRQKQEFTVCPVKPAAKLLTKADIKEKLQSFISCQDNNEEIFDWVEGNISEEGINEPSFVRALITAVFEHAITGAAESCELSLEKLKYRLPLLVRYVAKKEDLQLEALYAVQALTTQLGQPKGLLQEIFEFLYDDDIIYEETFNKWEDYDNPDEQVGKSVALQSVTSFFSWLRESDDDSEEG